MKKTLFALLIVFFFSNTYAQTEIPSAELRAIQSRLFATSVDKVLEAFKTYCEDSGGNFMARPNIAASGKPSDTQSGNCMMGMKVPSAKNAAGTAAATSAATGLFSAIPFLGAAVSVASSAKSLSDMDEMMSSIGEMKYEIKSSPKGSESIVRIRLMQRDQTQITDTQVYEKMYGKISEELSIPASQIK